jgi:hypothetical protein
MKRIVLVFVLVGPIGGVAEARPAPRPVVQHGRTIHPIHPRPKKNFVGFLIDKIIVPVAVGAVEMTVRGAVVAAL